MPMLFAFQFGSEHRPAFNGLRCRRNGFWLHCALLCGGPHIQILAIRFGCSFHITSSDGN